MSVWIGKTGTIRLSGVNLTRLRDDCYFRDGGMCTKCGVWLRKERGYRDSMHMAHIQGRGAGGSDVIENVTSKCAHCHLVLEHNPKSVPPKART